MPAIERNGQILLLPAIGVLLYFFFRSKDKMASPIAFRFRPVPGKVTSSFGNRVHPITGALTFHNGVDLAAATGTPVKAPADGTVMSVYSNSAGGKQIVVRHSNFTTGYAHLSTQDVIVGQKVTAGQVIAKSGATGNVTGPHLHLTLKDASGAYIDPVRYLA